MKNNFWEYIKSSLDTHTTGASARKLTAFIIVICVFVAHIAWIRICFLRADFSLMTTVLTIDYAFVGALLGMTTIESIKKNNNDKEVNIKKEENGNTNDKP